MGVVSGRMGSEEERVKQEVVSTPKISEEDKELKKMATTVEEGVRQDMVSTAVRFLENDRVRASTDEMKRKFLLKLLLLIGGASYGLRYLWKTYIAPWLFGPPKPVPNPQAAVVETCQAVLGGVQQLQTP